MNSFLPAINTLEVEVTDVLQKDSDNKTNEEQQLTFPGVKMRIMGLENLNSQGYIKGKRDRKEQYVPNRFE